MLIKTLPVGHMEANCYVVADENTLQCAVIDPGDEINTIMDYIEQTRLTVKAILITHCHFDHTGAVESLMEETGAVVYVNPADGAAETGRSRTFVIPRSAVLIGDGDTVEVGGLKFTVLSTPGHSPGSVCFTCENALFTGDTLFEGSCGRTDLPGGDMDQMMASLRRLARLEGDYEVYPGHMDATTLDLERANNYYMRYALGE